MKPFLLYKDMVFSKFSGILLLSHLSNISSGMPFVINLNSLVIKLYTIALELKVPFLINLLYILSLYDIIWLSDILFLIRLDIFGDMENSDILGFISINKGNREIKRIHPYSLREEATEDEVYDLIQAGLVEKVGEIDE